MIAHIQMIEATQHYQTVDQINEEMELVKAAQNDPRCFEPLYKKYYKRIVSFVFHRIESKELAFEITAQVFYKALENLQKYKTQGVPFSAWLFRIASNELNQVFRKNKASRIVDIDSHGVENLMVSIEEKNTALIDEQLFNALQQLDADEMELIDMRYFEQRSFKEMADITGLNESACKMRVYRTLEKLKETLKNK